MERWLTHKQCCVSIITLCLQVSIFVGCQAPRDNPFDPLSPSYRPSDPPGAIITGEARSIRLAQWGEPPNWDELEISATIIDSNGVDSVWVMLDDVNIGILEPNRNEVPWDEASWINSFHDEVLIGKIATVIGHPITVNVLDSDGFTTKGEPFFLTRLIDDPPVTFSPVNDEVVSRLPTMEWEPYFTDFSYTFSIQIVHVPESFIEKIVYKHTDIGFEETTHTVQDTLTASPRFLYWTVSVIDEFGNEARSLEAKFRVTDNE